MKATRKLTSFLKKLTFIDFLLIVTFIAGGILFYQFINPKEKWIEVTVFAQNVPAFQTATLGPGDIEKNPTGKKVAEIISLSSYDASTPISAPETQTGKNLSIDSKILIKINPRNGDYEFKNKIVKIGTPIDLSFNSGIIKGIVGKLEGVTLKSSTVTKLVTLILYSQPQWLIDSIEIGSGEIDENGEKSIEIVKKELKSTGNPDTSDLVLSVRLKTQKIPDGFLFREKTLLIGESISFKAKKTLIQNALITDISD